MRVGLLGCGTVGSALIQLLQEQAEGIESRTGLRLEIARVAVRNASKDRGVDLPRDRFTNDAASVVNDPDVDVVIEVIGGIEPARQLILDALKAGKPVVTANKELLANVGAEVFATAEASGVDVLFEAAVGGGIPLVRPLRESLLGEPIDQVMGIVNGTTNYILTRMTESGASYDEALAEAQAARATPRPIPPPTSRATTPGPRSPSWPASRSAPGWWPATSTTRASRASPPPTSPSPAATASWSSWWPSPRS